MNNPIVKASVRLESEILGLPVKTERDLVTEIRKGIPAICILQIERLGFNKVTVIKTIGPRTTIERKIRSNSRLTPAQSNRLLRMVRIIGQANDTFGNPDKARQWLERETTMFGADEAPLSLLDTDQGARLVEARLLQISHGMSA